MSWLELWAALRVIGNCIQIVIALAFIIFAGYIIVGEMRFRASKDKARREQYRLDDIRRNKTLDNAKLDK